MARRFRILLVWFTSLLLSDKRVSCFSGGFGRSTSRPRRRRIRPKSAKKSTAGTKSNGATTLQSFDLGKGKAVQIYVPPDKYSAAKDGESMKKDDFYGTGDVVWPASFALARLLAFCPSFVQDKNILELGTGLGLVSTSVVAHAKPKRVWLSDRDPAVLSLARKSCQLYSHQKNSNGIPVETLLVDWMDEDTFPKNDDGDDDGDDSAIDVVVGSDILFHEPALESLARLLAHVLIPAGERAMIVDPRQRQNREAFLRHLERVGLDGTAVPFPGSERDFVLINVTPK